MIPQIIIIVINAMDKKHRVLEDCITEGPCVVWEGQGRLTWEGWIKANQVKLGSKERKSIPGRGSSIGWDKNRRDVMPEY